jgi:hypothetical protein
MDAWLLLASLCFWREAFSFVASFQCDAVPFSFNGYNQPGTNGTASARKCGVAAWTGISGGDLGAGGSCRATSGAKGTFTKNPHSIIVSRSIENCHPRRWKWDHERLESAE